MDPIQWRLLGKPLSDSVPLSSMFPTHLQSKLLTDPDSGSDVVCAVSVSAKRYFLLHHREESSNTYRVA